MTSLKQLSISYQTACIQKHGKTLRQSPCSILAGGHQSLLITPLLLKLHWENMDIKKKKEKKPEDAIFNPVFLYILMTELSTRFIMLVNSEVIVTETASIAHTEFQLHAFHPKENLKYHGNVYHSNIPTDPSRETNSWISR